MTMIPTYRGFKTSRFVIALSGTAIVSGLIIFSGVNLAGCHRPAKSAADQQPRQVHERQIRAMWVTRWDYKSPEDIRRVMKNCRSAGFNTVLFQVRGAGTVMYPSPLETWAKEFDHRDPGFDPLKTACAEARRNGLSLHAWVNVMPGYRGKQPPNDRRQLYHARADWFWRDSAGQRQPLGWYNSLNPCYPEVRRYLSDVMHDIVRRYDVDGIHLDYIRFPNEWNNSYPEGAEVPDYPRDSRTLAMFRAETGHTPESHPQAWSQWRTAQVTRLLREIRDRVKAVDQNIVLSAAVGASPARARSEHFQDSIRWVNEHLLDAIYPMNYTDNMQEFERRAVAWARVRPNMPVVMGIMFDKRDGKLVNSMIAKSYRTGTHFAAFAYNSLFERPDGKGQFVQDGRQRDRAELRREVLPVISQRERPRRVADRAGWSP